MKTTFRIVYIMLAGLFVAIIAYPFMHETGHTIMPLICGAKVMNYELFPLPNILCDISGLTHLSIILIGVSGVIFPMISSAFLHPRKFYFWYPSFVFKGIVWLSLIISIITTVLNHFGITDQNDDMVKVIGYWENGEAVLTIILIVLLLLVSISMVKDQPIKRINKEFE